MALINGMPKKKSSRKKKNEHSKPYSIILGLLRAFNRTVLFILQIPYFAYKGIRGIAKESKKTTEKAKVRRKRQSMSALYEPLVMIEQKKGLLSSFESMLSKKDSAIGIIVGSRGSGKSAFGMKLIENIHATSSKKIHAMGFEEKELPAWIRSVGSATEISNDSWVLIDEGGILFSSRKSMSHANQVLSELILIARHKGLSILFISQNSSNLDVNILRQADFLILRQPSLLQLEFERDAVKKLYEKYKTGFDSRMDVKGLSLIYSNEFVGFVSNSLPSFWTRKLSTSFREAKEEKAT
jgi:hypothetical protein